MNESAGVQATIESAILDTGSISQVMELLVEEVDGGLLVCGRVDLPADLSLREVSVVLFRAKQRVRDALPEAHHIFLEPDVWVDPNAVQPTTSAIVTTGYN